LGVKNNSPKGDFVFVFEGAMRIYLLDLSVEGEVNPSGKNLRVLSAEHTSVAG